MERREVVGTAVEGHVVESIVLRIVVKARHLPVIRGVDFLRRDVRPEQSRVDPNRRTRSDVKYIEVIRQRVIAAEFVPTDHEVRLVSVLERNVNLDDLAGCSFVEIVAELHVDFAFLDADLGGISRLRVAYLVPEIVRRLQNGIKRHRDLVTGLDVSNHDHRVGIVDPFDAPVRFPLEDLEQFVGVQFVGRHVDVERGGSERRIERDARLRTVTDCGHRPIGLCRLESLGSYLKGVLVRKDDVIPVVNDIPARLDRIVGRIDRRRSVRRHGFDRIAE